MKLLIQFHYSLFFQGSHIDNGQGFLTSHQVFDLWIYNTHIATVPTQFITEIPRKPVQLTAPNTILRVTFITPETSEPNLIVRFRSSDSALVRNSPDPFTTYAAKRASRIDREDTNFPPDKRPDVRISLFRTHISLFHISDIRIKDIFKQCWK